MKDTRVFLGFWLANSLIFYLAPSALTGMVVTGNVRLSSLMASLVSGLLLTLALAVTEPNLKYFNVKLKQVWHYALVYLGVNIASIWVIARYADLTGVGVASVYVAILLGVIFNLVQWGVWKFAKPSTKK